MDVKERGDLVGGKGGRRKRELGVWWSACVGRMNGHRMPVQHVLTFEIVVLPTVVRVGLPKAGTSEH